MTWSMALRVGHGCDAEALLGEIAVEQVAQALVVVDDEDVGDGGGKLGSGCLHHGSIMKQLKVGRYAWLVMVRNAEERIRILQGDITLQQVDAIVNAANSTLLGGGGVDGAIHRAAGPQLLEYCRTLGGCPTGEARLSPGFQLCAKWVIHTVGPVWQGGGADEDRLLACCYRNSLLLAAQQHVRTIAFPQISTGVYGYPLRRAASIAIAEIRAFLSRPCSIEEVRCVVFSEASRSAVSEAFAAAADYWRRRRPAGAAGSG